MFLLCHYFAAEECIRTAKAVLPSIKNQSRIYDLEDEIQNWSARCMKYLRELHALDECPENYRELFAIRSCPLFVGESWRFNRVA